MPPWRDILAVACLVLLAVGLVGAELVSFLAILIVLGAPHAMGLAILATAALNALFGWMLWRMTE